MDARGRHRRKLFRRRIRVGLSRRRRSRVRAEAHLDQRNGIRDDAREAGRRAGRVVGARDRDVRRRAPRRAHRCV